MFWVICPFLQWSPYFLSTQDDKACRYTVPVSARLSRHRSCALREDVKLPSLPRGNRLTKLRAWPWCVFIRFSQPPWVPRTDQWNLLKVQSNNGILKLICVFLLRISSFSMIKWYKALIWATFELKTSTYNMAGEFFCFHVRTLFGKWKHFKTIHCMEYSLNLLLKPPSSKDLFCGSLFITQNTVCWHVENEWRQIRPHVLQEWRLVD